MSRVFNSRIISDQEWADLHTIELDILWSKCGECYNKNLECVRHTDGGCRHGD